MELSASLVPFWFKPDEENHPDLRFLLAPLTQPHLAQLNSTEGLGQHDGAAVELLYRAGVMAIREMEGVTYQGKTITNPKWPIGKEPTLVRALDLVPYEIVLLCGRKVWRDATVSEDEGKN